MLMWSQKTVLVLSTLEKRQGVSGVDTLNNPSEEPCQGQILGNIEHQNIIMLMRVLGHPGYGNSMCYVEGNWTSV